ncbi:MAG: hypothetical protein AAF518_16580 [Spirochaetota bacterium]
MAIHNLARAYWNSLTFFVYKTIAIVLIPGTLGFFYIWQNVKYTHLNRQIQIMNRKKDKLLRKNNELRVDIASSTSAERMEALYKKVYNSLPSTRRNRIITITLPSEAGKKEQ